MEHDTKDLTLTKALQTLLRRMRTILPVALSAALLAGAATWLAVPRRFSSDVTLYVYTNQQSASTGILTSSDLLAAEGFLETCAHILLGDTVLSSISMALEDGFFVSVDQLRQMTEVEPIDGTLLLQITVTSDSAELSYAVAREFARSSPGLIPSVTYVGGAEVVNQPQPAATHNSVPVAKNSVMAFCSAAALMSWWYLNRRNGAMPV